MKFFGQCPETTLFSFKADGSNSDQKRNTSTFLDENQQENDQKIEHSEAVITHKNILCEDLKLSYN